MRMIETSGRSLSNLNTLLRDRGLLDETEALTPENEEHIEARAKSLGICTHNECIEAEDFMAVKPTCLYGKSSQVVNFRGVYPHHYFVAVDEICMDLLSNGFDPGEPDLHWMTEAVEKHEANVHKLIGKHVPLLDYDRLIILGLVALVLSRSK